MKPTMYIPFALFLFVLGCSDTATTTTTQTRDTVSTQPPQGSISEDKTKQVLDHHWQAFTQNNMDEVMADYTEESVLITPDATYKGLDQIRKNFESAYTKFPKEKSDFKLTKQVLDRDVAYILWQAKTPTFNLTYATDTFIIRDGKIIRQTYAGVATAL